VQNTWENAFPYHSVKCIQDDDCTISLHLSEIFSHEE
jgi:hypothetical protein